MTWIFLYLYFILPNLKTIYRYRKWVKIKCCGQHEFFILIYHYADFQIDLMQSILAYKKSPKFKTSDFLLYMISIIFFQLVFSLII